MVGEEGGRVGSILRLDILSVDGTIIWEEMGAMVDGDALVQAEAFAWRSADTWGWGWGGR